MREGILQPNSSIFGRFIAGRWALLAVFILAGILRSVSWDFSECSDICIYVLDALAMLYPNISQMLYESSNITDFQIGSVISTNLIGTIMLPITVWMSFKHASIIPDENVRALSKSKLAVFGIIAFIFLFIGVWSGITYTGYSSLFPDLFLASKIRFLLGGISIWWFANLMLFIFTAILILNSKGRV